MIPFFDAKNYILRDPYSLMAGIRDQGSGIRDQENQALHEDTERTIKIILQTNKVFTQYVLIIGLFLIILMNIFNFA